jgi:hypothetical protein
MRRFIFTPFPARQLPKMSNMEQLTRSPSGLAFKTLRFAATMQSGLSSNDPHT